VRFVVPVVVIALSLATSGCSTLFKDDYWSQIRTQSDADELARLRDDPAASFFLGVRASAAEVPFQVGVSVQHVYAESPAARAGLRAGDEIRVIDQYPVRTPGDVRWVLSSLWKAHEPDAARRRAALDVLKPETFSLVYHLLRPHLATRIVYSRDGREVESQIELTSREAYLEVRRRRVLDFSHYERSGYNGWYLSSKRTIPPELVADYFGVKVDADVVVSEDTDVLPLVFGISIFRKEDVPVADATRVTVICSLIQFSSRGDDVARTLAGLIPDPPAGSTDL
jgi:hypothetical protein